MSEVSSNTCPGCKELTLPGKAFCANCGAPLNNDSSRIKALIDEALESRFKDRDYVTMETSVGVASKLTDWFKLFLYWAAIPLGVLALILTVLGFFLGVFGFHSYSDFTAKVADATTQVQNASQAAMAKDKEVSANLGGLESHVQSAESQVSELQASSVQMGQKYAQLQKDYGRYDQIDQKIGALQSQLTAVQGQVVDMGHRKLIAGSFETTGTDENGKEWDSSVMLGRPGCGPSSLNERHSVALCVLSSPLRPFVFLSQRSPNGDVMPVGSVSPVGFQDVSIAPKPACTVDRRGTIYVEKGNRGGADKPYLCVMNPSGSSRWVELQLVP
jgi:hypothetical protein